MYAQHISLILFLIFAEVPAVKRAFIIIFTCLMLCGCEALTFSIDNLLSAPSVADEQAAIHQALIESVGAAVAPSYPRSGDYRSAFIVADIDGDGNDEALAFYTISGQSGAQNVRVSVLDSSGDGKWHAMYELAGRGTYVDTVILADYGETVDIIIGYGGLSYEEGSVSIYRYAGGVLTSIYDSAYSVLDRWDIDSCGTDETVIVKKAGTEVTVSVIKTLDGLDYITRERTLSSSAAYISGCSFGEVDQGVNALFIDTVNENSITFTEIVYMSDGVIVSPTSDNSELLLATGRMLGYPTMDFDGDGSVEIPIISPFLGYSPLTQSNIEHLTRWLDYDIESGSFTEEAQSYFNAAAGYIFKLPNRWQNFVTVAQDADTGETVFSKYDYELQNVSDMPRLMSIAAVDPENKQIYLDNGYSYIGGTDFVCYMYKNIADESEPLLLTNDEIRSNMYFIGQ